MNNTHQFFLEAFSANFYRFFGVYMTAGLFYSINLCFRDSSLFHFLRINKKVVTKRLASEQNKLREGI